MIIYPAIDLIGGAVVRLHKGDFDQQTTYGTDPVAVAQAYAAAGASWLHLVDLDGAKNPQNRQTKLIGTIIAESGLQVQTGGGIRTMNDVEALVDAGASRIVIGSLAVRDADTTKAIFTKFGPDKICLAADVVMVDGAFHIAVSGWQEASSITLEAFLTSYMPAGLRHILCTDIDRDGTLTGCNRDLYQVVKAQFPTVQVQASGGIGQLDDLKDLGADGVIIGKALYEGRFTVQQAMEAVTC
jgi:phosphoribosylformimino-5-aminoimidazole carboxamide ribotide isomerase